MKVKKALWSLWSLWFSFSQQAAPAEAKRSERCRFSKGNHEIPANEKHLLLRGARWPNLAIVSSYNDMLSAHRPLERYPELIVDAVHEMLTVDSVPKQEKQRMILRRLMSQRAPMELVRDAVGALRALT